MKIYENVKAFFEKKARYWFVMVAILIILEIANYGFLGMIAQAWVCACISIVLILLSTFYIAFMYRYAHNKYKNYMTDWNNKLLERVDTLEIHISELNNKNIELESKLTKAIQDRIDENTSKVISELTSSIETFSDTLEQQIYAFEDNLNIRLKKEAENINTNIKEGFNAQEKLAINNSEVLINKADSTTTDLSETIHTCSADIKSKVSNLSNEIEKFRKDEKDHSGEVISIVTEQGDKTIKLLSHNHAENEKHLAGISEMIRLSGEEERSAITEEAGRIIQNAYENRAAQEIFISEQMSSLREVNAGMCVRIVETSSEGRELIEDLSDSIAALANTVICGTEGIKSEATQHTEQIISIIAEEAARDGKEQQAMKALIEGDAEKIATGIIKQAERIIIRIDEKAAIDADVQNNNGNFMVELKERMETIGMENRTASSGETEKILASLEDSRKEQVELYNEQKEEIQHFSVQIEQKTESIINTSAGTTTTLLYDMKNAMSVDTERITTQVTDNTAHLSAKMGEIAQQENSAIEHAVERMERKIAEALGVWNDLLVSVRTSIAALDEAIENGNTKISGELSGHMERVLNDINDVGELERQTLDVQDKKFHELGSQIALMKQFTDDKTEALSAKATDMQNEFTRMLVQVLNDSDDHAEKANRAYDRLFNQVSGFSNKTKASIDQLQQALELQRQFAINDKKEAASAASEQFTQTQSLKDKADAYSRLAEKHRSEIVARLNNLQNQFFNLNSLTDLLKNVLEIIRKEGEYKETSKQAASDLNPNRTEEIKDLESGVTVLNHYKTNQLFLSELVSGKKKTYDVEYDDLGRIVKSRNYDPSGKITAELQFYSNGQVKTRMEKIHVNGKLQTIISKFDEQGNKLK